MEGREHMIRNEINILRKVSQGHKNILSLVDYFETLNNRTYRLYWRLFGSIELTLRFSSVPCDGSCDGR